MDICRLCLRGVGGAQMCLQIFNADSADNKVAEVLRQHFWFEVCSSYGAHFPGTRLPLI